MKVSALYVVAVALLPKAAVGLDFLRGGEERQLKKEDFCDAMNSLKAYDKDCPKCKKELEECNNCRNSCYQSSSGNDRKFCDCVKKDCDNNGMQKYKRCKEECDDKNEAEGQKKAIKEALKDAEKRAEKEARADCDTEDCGGGDVGGKP